MAYVTLVPRGLLVPIIMIFCVTGTFVASGNPWDVWIMVAFGIIGCFAQKYRFSPAGILLGVILGPIAEQGLRNVLVLSDDNPLPYFFTRWISVILILMILAAIYFSLRPKAWEKVEEGSEAAEAGGVLAEGAGMERSADKAT